jgi:hypothetical protein
MILEFCAKLKPKTHQLFFNQKLKFYLSEITKKILCHFDFSLIFFCFEYLKCDARIRGKTDHWMLFRNSSELVHFWHETGNTEKRFTKFFLWGGLQKEKKLQNFKWPDWFIQAWDQWMRSSWSDFVRIFCSIVFARMKKGGFWKRCHAIHLLIQSYLPKRLLWKPDNTWFTKSCFVKKTREFL